MLKMGLKSGRLIDYKYLNLIAKTAEQIMNVNICSKMTTLSDTNETNTLNSFVHHQFRSRLTLIAVRTTKDSLTVLDYPSLKDVKDKDGNSVFSAFNSIDESLEEFDHYIENEVYKVSFLKKTYSVDSSAIDKTLLFDFYPIDSNAKDLSLSYLNSFFVLQVDDTQKIINLVEDNEKANSSFINKIKEAFRLNMSYNLVSMDSIGGRVYYSFSKYFTNMIDFYNISSEHGDEVEIIRPLSDDRQINYFLDSGTVSSSLIDETIYSDTIENKIILNSIIKDHSTIIKGGLSLTTSDTENHIIDSLLEDSLNSYDLIMLNRDFANRLQGKLYYPVLKYVARPPAYSGYPASSINITMNNNIDNLDFNKELTLINGYKLKFAIS